MKKFITFVSLFFLTSTSAEFVIYPNAFLNAVHPDYSGSWYLNQEDGWGVITDWVEDNRLVGWVFTYDMEGTPVWLYLDGLTLESTWSGDVYYSSGLRYDHLKEDQPREQVEWGKFVMIFNECNQADFYLDQAGPQWAGDDRGLDWNLERLTYMGNGTCEDFVPNVAGRWRLITALEEDTVTFFGDGSFYLETESGCRMHSRISKADEDGELKMSVHDASECDPTDPGTHYTLDGQYYGIGEYCTENSCWERFVMEFLYTDEAGTEQFYRFIKHPDL